VEGGKSRAADRGRMSGRRRGADGGAVGGRRQGAGGGGRRIADGALCENGRG
jgi:hypothetical protein